MSKSIGILTGGGDAPGLNAVIRAVVKYASGVKGWTCYGIEESFNGLMFEDKEVRLYKCTLEYGYSSGSKSVVRLLAV